MNVVDHKSKTEWQWQLRTIWRFSTECRKTETKTITTANHSKENITRESMRMKVKQANFLKRGKTRESQGTIGFSFKFDWLRRRRELFEPIIEQS